MQKQTTFKRYVVFDRDNNTFWDENSCEFVSNLADAYLYADSDDALNAIQDECESVKEVEVTYKITTI